MANQFGFDNINTMGEGSKGLADSTSQLKGKLNSMLDEMEEIHSAVKGETENSFTQARNELESCFSDLITWNSQTSEKLSEGQGAVMNTVAQTTETVQSAADGIGALARNPNR